jgi:hypothetical protein
VTARAQRGGALDALGIVHTIGDSIASSIAGEPRSTIDIDIVAAVRESDVLHCGSRCQRTSTWRKRRCAAPSGNVRASTSFIRLDELTRLVPSN